MCGTLAWTAQPISMTTLHADAGRMFQQPELPVFRAATTLIQFTVVAVDTDRLEVV